jgi:hypothetical protein
MEEYIICSAIHFHLSGVFVHSPINIKEGLVVAGRRHHNCFAVFANTSFEKPVENTQVFLTNTNRFVDRKEAYKIAFEADQIIGPNKGKTENYIGLTSEDLY